MHTGGHILTGFNEALIELQDTTITMGTQALSNIDNSIHGLLKRDKSLCNQSIADDDEEDRLEMEVDRMGMALIVKYRPLASDLRLVIASMKIASNLERISDHAVSIAKRARKMLKNEEVEQVYLLEPLYKDSRLTLTQALQSYVDGDLKLALEIIADARNSEKMSKRATKKLTKILEKDNGHERDYLDLMFITRYLERVKSLSINIAEDVVFTQSNMDVRHGGELPDLED